MPYSWKRELVEFIVVIVGMIIVGRIWPGLTLVQLLIAGIVIGLIFYAIELTIYKHKQNKDKGD